MIQTWIEFGLDPNAKTMDGSTILDFALKMHMVEHIRVLLLHDAEAPSLSPVMRAQVLGDAFKVKDLILGGAKVNKQQVLSRTKTGVDDDPLPLLHRAVLKGDDEDAVAKVCEELECLSEPSAALSLLDGAKLPATFYAVELGHVKVARALFERAHGFPTALVDKL